MQFIVGVFFKVLLICQALIFTLSWNTNCLFLLVYLELEFCTISAVLEADVSSITINCPEDAQRGRRNRLLGSIPGKFMSLTGKRPLSSVGKSIYFLWRTSWELPNANLNVTSEILITMYIYGAALGRARRTISPFPMNIHQRCFIWSLNSW